MSCLKCFTLKAILRVLGSLCQVLNPTYDKLGIPNFDLRKGSFNFLIKCAWPPYYRQKGKKPHLNSQDNQKLHTAKLTNIN